MSIGRALLVAMSLCLIAAEPASRSFRCTYLASVSGLPADRTARIWIPVPSSGPEQTVKLESLNLPAPGRMSTESTCHNKVLYLAVKTGGEGPLSLEAHYRVTRQEGKEGPPTENAGEEDLTPYLASTPRVPVGGKPARLLKGRKLPDDPIEKGRALFDIVHQHMRYSKEGTGWGQGDAVWACDSKYGNCTDFHSLFMSLARTEKIPARFAIGFLLPKERGKGEIPGYHCWAYFKPRGHGWIPVDISEASKDPAHRDDYFGKLSENRVAFSVGRDLLLEPRQDGPPLNFFLSPYVEVDGKPWPASRLKVRLIYEDIPPSK